MESDAVLSARDSAWLEERVRSEGFDLCGIVTAAEFPDLARNREWLDRGYAGAMLYLDDARRESPDRVMPGVRTAIVCGLNYNTARPYSTEFHATDGESPRGWISRYAWGNDYHEVLWAKLNAVIAAMREHFAQPFEARGYADTGPIHERELARQAGLGWVGKHTLLINQGIGSWFFLGVILTTLELPKRAETPSPDFCGTCTRCIEACPTEAIVEPYVLDARRCISYLTIELREPIPMEFREAMGRHVFGCDICQDVCPWNRKAKVTDSANFQPRMLRASDASSEPLFLPDLEHLAGLTEDEFRNVFRASAIKRTKWRGLVRNACNALGNSGGQLTANGRRRVRELLARLSKSPDPMVRDSAQWGLSRIQEEAGATGETATAERGPSS